MESSTGRLAAIALVVLIPAGLVLSRLLGRRMGDFRRDHLGEIDRVLRDLAATAGGEFESGPLLANHPLLGKLHRYGTARLSAGGLQIEVSVSYPGDDRNDDHTTVRIVAPIDQRWRLAKLHLCEPCSWTNDPAAIDAEISRCFELVGAEWVGLPLPARSALVRLGARASSLDLHDDALELTAAAAEETTYVAPVARLRTLVEQAVEAAESLLVPVRR